MPHNLPKDQTILDKPPTASPVQHVGEAAGSFCKALESRRTDKNDLDIETESSVNNGAAGAIRHSFATYQHHKQSQNIQHPVSPPPERRKGQKPYTLRIYRNDDYFHEVTMALSTMVAELLPKLKEKLPVCSGETYKLYVTERGKERLLGLTEKPARLVKRRLEDHGTAFTLDKRVINSFEHINLEHRAIVAISIAVHRNAAKLVSLSLSGNPILEIPVDFIHSCVSLRDLRLFNMFMKNVPNSVRHATSIRRLDLSSNRIRSLEEASLDWNANLQVFYLQNNHIENLPQYFPRLRYLTTLNISNNKLYYFPLAICELNALVDLDISFNTISELPEEIGNLVNLSRFTILGNIISQLPEECSKLVCLSRLDCRRNKLINLGLVTRLPKLHTLIADHNAVHKLNLLLGPKLKMLNTSHNKITQLSLVLVPVGHARQGYDMLDTAAQGRAGLFDLHGEGKASKVLFWSDGSSSSMGMVSPPLAHSLKRLYLGKNRLTDDHLYPLMQFCELRVLNLSFNELRELPRHLFSRLERLEEVYLSGNKIASVPTEDLHRLERLRTLYLNGNKLHTLPQELQRLKNLTSLDVGSNQLKYNTNTNWEFDWNWNLNKNLKYLNLSGNSLLQIKVDELHYYGNGTANGHKPNTASSTNMSSFTNLKQLRVLGLMDVTLPTIVATIPNENDERRVRTSISTILNMSYGIADALGKNNTLTMLDLAQEIHTKENPSAPGAMFAMFERSQLYKPPYP
ncbi:hypothetical protein H0H92_007749, partial [Tricholoma furcatifolium]